MDTCNVLLRRPEKGVLVQAQTSSGVSSFSMIRRTTVETGIFRRYFPAKAFTAPTIDAPSATYTGLPIYDCH